MSVQRRIERNPKKVPKRRLRFGRVIVILVALVLVVFVLVPVGELGLGYYRLHRDLTALSSAERARNFPAIASGLGHLSAAMASIDSAVHQFGYLSHVPQLGSLYRSGVWGLAAAEMALRGVRQMEPALARIAPSMGYSTGPATTANLKASRLQGLVDHLTTLAPALRTAYPSLVAANQDLQHMNPRVFPGGLGQKIVSLQAASASVMKNLPLIFEYPAAIQNILGAPTPKRYFLAFQNSGELRATGGFMTAYGLMHFNQGKLGKIAAQNIYLLDAKVTYHPAAPTPIATYLPVYYWHLRDANTSPNVPTTAQNIYQFYQSVPGVPHINGVVFVDTWFVDQLIGDVGGLTVSTPKGPMHVTAANANVQMEKMAEGLGLPSSQRKLFIGSMMHQLLHDALHAHGTVLAKVIHSVDTALTKKYIVLYFNNPQAEQMVASQNWGGIIPQYVNGNYLQVVDENLLGHKDNYFIHDHVATQIQKIGNRYQETTSITYVNPAIDNNWLTVPYRSYVRFYVPEGSRLISLTGANGLTQAYVNTSLHKVVFGGHVSLPPRTSSAQPDSTATVTVRYWLPRGINMHRMLVQKQPGIKHETYSVRFGSYHKTFALHQDTWIKLP